jgi:transcriptional regulator with XRE-family HTH domain
MGSRLKDARLRLGLTQEALGKRAGVPQASVHRAEASQSFPQGDHAAKLYKAVGLTLDDLLADIEAKRVAREELMK